MPGPLPEIETTVEAVLLDVNRLLTMGNDVALELYVPDQAAVSDPVGMRLVRRYEQSFNRLTEDEAERGDGQTVIFAAADYPFPAGQLAEDLGQKELYLRWIQDGGPSEFCKVNKVERPGESTAQVYTITAKRRTFKQTYFGRA